jgi:hypothetical protein
MKTRRPRSRDSSRSTSFQRAQAHGDRQGLALGADGLGRVGPGLERGGDDVFQQAFVHPADMAGPAAPGQRSG